VRLLASFAQALLERGHEVCKLAGQFAAENRHHRLLRPRGERPRCRAAEQRDEVASFQLIELHSIPASQGRIVGGYRIGEDQSGG
jgi:hypothetical protein